MNLINDCFERIKVISGVNNGWITNEQIQAVIVRYRLDAEQKEIIFELLHNKGIYPVSENEFVSVYLKSRVTDGADEKRSLTKEERIEIREEKFAILCTILKNNPDCLKQYLEEMSILKRAIVEQRKKSERKSSWIIACAVMEICSYRTRNKRNRGWVCGTHMSKVRDSFQYWLDCFFMEDELAELIRGCCEEDELSFEQQKMFLLFLNKTPHAIVHPWSYQSFED